MQKSEVFVKNISEVPEYANFISYVDGKLYTEDGCSFEIHKIALAKKSIYFGTLFTEICNNRKEFFIPRISGRCLNEILLYMYNDNIRLNSENVIDILMASDYFKITDLRTIIQENVKDTLSTDNSLKLLELSDQLKDQIIFRESFRFIQVKFEEIMGLKTDDFIHLSFENLKTLLTTRSLNIQSERTAWLAIEAWIRTRESERKIHVPFLLKCLALGDMDENLATEIMDHDLIINNSHVKKLCPSKDSSSRNHDRLKSIVLKHNTDLMNDVFGNRIPQSLHIIEEIDDDRNSCQLYITYDENLDLWRRMLEVPFIPILVNIEHNLYIFSELEFDGCFKMDLRNGLLVPLNEQEDSFFRVSSTVIKNKVYFLKEHRENNLEINLENLFKKRPRMFSISIFDSNTDSWAEDTTRLNLDHGQCVSVGKCIFVVGFIENEDVMTVYVFDTTEPRSGWNKILGPIARLSWFRLEPYRNKIFLFGCHDHTRNKRSVKALNVESHRWIQLEDLPFQPLYLGTVMLNDRLFAYDTSYEVNSKIAVWNDDLEKWVRLEVKGTLETFKWILKGFEFDANSFWQNRRDKRESCEKSSHGFCTIKNTEAISALFNQNKKLPFVRSYFSEKNTFELDWFFE